MNSLCLYIENSADKYPSKVAVSDDNKTYTYSLLKSTARKIATKLIEINAENIIRPVVVYMPRCVDGICAFMSALYSGNPYVPINYSLPDARLKNTLENLNPLCVITDEAGVLKINSLYKVKVFTFEEISKTEENKSVVDKAIDNTCDCDPAYIIYTSGSTGNPKGVTVSHRGAMDYIDSMLCEFDIDETAVIGMQSPFYFDISVFDMFMTFCTGAELVVIPDAIFMYPNMVPDYVNEHKINLIYWVPTVLVSIANSGVLSEKVFDNVKTVIFAGETMPTKQLNIWRRAMPDCSYTNLFGPTETSVISMIYKVDRDFADDEPLPIGHALNNTRAYILDEQNRLVTQSEVRGEICFGGIGNGLGYWNNKEISDRVFVQNPLNTNYHERIYRTGDVGYYDENGVMMFAGRSDTQIKHRGNRIELGDIEAAASSIVGVESNCALYDKEKGEIVIFVQTKENLVLRKFNLELKKHIPSYMLPSRLVTLCKMPHTPNGKTDRVFLRKTYLEEN